MQWINTLFNKVGELFNWWFTVVPWQRAIRVRLGKHITVLGPGIHLQVPFIDHIYVQNIRTRVAATTSQALTTKDGHTITLCAGIRFDIVDLYKVYNRLHQANNTICQEVEGHFSEYIITHDVAECVPDRVLEYVKKHTDLEQYGLRITNLFLTDFVRTKTYRLIQGGLDRYANASLETCEERRGKNKDYADG